MPVKNAITESNEAIVAEELEAMFGLINANTECRVMAVVLLMDDSGQVYRSFRSNRLLDGQQRSQVALGLSSVMQDVLMGPQKT